MPSGRSASRPSVGAVLLLVVAAVVVVGSFVVRGTSFGDRRPEYVAPYTAAELRERPDIVDVLPDHVAATRALLEAVGETASVTWEPADAQVFVHQRDGVDEQVVDGYPALYWRPEHWTSTQEAELGEADEAALAQTFREVLEPRGYSVSTADRGRPMHGGLFHFTASDPHGGSLQLVDIGTDGPLRVIALTDVHLYRGDTCGADPLACFPAVEDPAAGL